MGKAAHADGAGQRSAIVVGAGIGGLAAGVALARRGRQVKVLERAATFGEVGAGLSLWPNGMRALGVGGHVREQALVERRWRTRSRWLCSWTPMPTRRRRWRPTTGADALAPS
ncbi:FAD-dependent oxidoreductase [Streptomyces sp. NPDC006655]|uniref:FAD-dependent oxidoreductase n=1 Tax=Streptomyces sp. NPDC006655 TaxID=3156898 RepID=UPI0034566C42